MSTTPGPPPLPEPPPDQRPFGHGPGRQGPDGHPEDPYAAPSGHGQTAYGQPSSQAPYGQAPPAPYGQPPYGQPPYGQAPYGQPQQYGYPGAPYEPYPGSPKPGTDGFAIAAFVLSILGGVLLSVIFGIVALRRIARTGRRGRGLAIAALAISAVWIVLIAVGIAAGIAGSAGRDQTGSVTKAGSVAANELKQGDCLRAEPTSAEVGSVDVTPCTSPHRAEVYAVFDLPGSSYPGDAKVQAQAGQGCDDRAPDLGAAGTKGLSEAYLYPKRGQWQLGDHSVTCIVSSSAQLTSKLVP